MSNEISKDIERNIQVMKSNLLRYEASVPPFMAQLAYWRETGYKKPGLMAPFGANKIANDFLGDGLRTAVEYFKLVDRVDGNFDPSWWKTDPGALVAYGYKLLFGSRLIDHTGAAYILFGLPKDDPLMKQARITLHQKYLYPKRGQPLLTAYADPDDKVHGARVDIMEVRAILKEQS